MKKKPRVNGSRHIAAIFKCIKWCWHNTWILLMCLTIRNDRIAATEKKNWIEKSWANERDRYSTQNNMEDYKFKIDDDERKKHVNISLPCEKSWIVVILMFWNCRKRKKNTFIRISSHNPWKRHYLCSMRAHSIKNSKGKKKRNELTERFALNAPQFFYLFVIFNFMKLS